MSTTGRAVVEHASKRGTGPRRVSSARLARSGGETTSLRGGLQGLTSGIDARVRLSNVLSGLLWIAAGLAILVWPGPEVTVVQRKR